MLSLAVFLSAFILFFILSPGVLLRLPPKGHKFTVAIVHAIVFSILFSLVLMVVQKVVGKEGLKHAKKCAKNIHDVPRSDIGAKQYWDKITKKKVKAGYLSSGASCISPSGTCYNGICKSGKCNPTTALCR